MLAHVRFASNPVDVETRGTLLQQLIDDQLCWHSSVWRLDNSFAPPSDEDFIITLE